jgi:hypothetical protein
MEKRLLFLLCGLICTSFMNLSAEQIKALSSENNKQQIRFTTKASSPKKFNSFTFFWKQPVIDKGAEMSYHLEMSDGRRTGEYYMEKGLKSNQNVRSDFIDADYPNFEELFTNEKITIVFLVDQGNMEFLNPDKYSFEFYDEVRDR